MTAIRAGVQAKGLVKKFRQGDVQVTALAGVDLDLAPGELVAVMGASGSGKSTLLHLLAGLTTADAGTVTVAGEDLLAASDAVRTRFRRRHIGLVFQAYSLVPTLDVEENITLPLALAGVPPDQEHLETLLRLLGLMERRRRFPDRLSGGEQQRVALARALIARPDVLLADEPTGNLDSANRERICALLAKLHEHFGTTVLVVSHDPCVAARAERVLLLEDGSIRCSLSRAVFRDAVHLAELYQEHLDREGTVCMPC